MMRWLSLLLHVGLSLLSTASGFGPCPAGVDPPVVGYSDWADLKSAIESSSSPDGVHSLCPNTTLDASPGTIFIQTPTVIQCGPDGNGDGCVVEGGLGSAGKGPQFLIDESSLPAGSLVRIQGLTMRGASSPLYVFGTSSKSSAGSKLIVERCQFTENDSTEQGSGGSGAAATIFGSAAVDVSKTFNVTFDRCTFERNVGGAVRIGNGRIRFKRCIFDSNEYGYSRGSCCSAISNGLAAGKLSISESCFISNTGAYVISVDSQRGASLDLNENNFGVGNTNSAGACKDIAVWSVGSSVCHSFEANECFPTRPTESPTSQPSNSPTSTPSAFPSQSPSVIPSLSAAPSNSLVPSSRPSLKPSDIPSLVPTVNPSAVPSSSFEPSEAPTGLPTAKPSELPSSSPSQQPTLSPSQEQSDPPSQGPSSSPSNGQTSAGIAFSMFRSLVLSFSSGFLFFLFS